MDVMIFLKSAPAVIGIAGLLTYFMMRAREPVSDLELVNIVQRVRNIFLLLGCVALIMLSVWLIRRPAPPDHDTVSPLAYRASNVRLIAARCDPVQCRARHPPVEILDEVLAKFGELCT